VLVYALYLLLQPANTINFVWGTNSLEMISWLEGNRSAHTNGA